MLRWARESAGYSIEDAAERLKVAVSHVEKWERGEGAVTFGRLDDLCSLYKRPSAIFYLAAPPEEDSSLPTDFRADDHTRTPGMILQVRRAKERRAIALEIAEELREDPARFDFECTIDENPEDVGARLRKTLQVETPLDGWSNDTAGRSGLRARRLAAEASGVLVFQSPGAELEHVSGFSIHFDVFPVAVIRASDSARRRSFTLLHELAHLGLRQGGLCDLHDKGIELYCNEVSAASMMPPDDVEREVRREQVSANPSLEELERLARNFSVSAEAMMLRLVTLDVVPLKTYIARKRVFEKTAAEAQPQSSGGNHYQTVLARNGDRFARLVIDAYHRGFLTGHRASKYLATSVDGLDRIAEDIARRALRRAS